MLRPHFDAILKAIVKNGRTKSIGQSLQGRSNAEAARTLFDVRDVLVYRGVLLRSHWVGGQRHGTVTVAKRPKEAPRAGNRTFARHWADRSLVRWFGAHVGGATPLMFDALR